MPVILFKVFNLFEDSFSDFIEDYHRNVVEKLNSYHRGMGVIGPENKVEKWRWSCIRITNGNISIDVVTSLESLYIYGYRRVFPDDTENPYNPWRLIEEDTKGFSGLDGEFEGINFDGEFKSMMFNGAYNNDVENIKVSRSSLEDAIYCLDSYAEALNKKELNKDFPGPTAPHTTKAKKCFLLVVLYIAESLRVLPIRRKVEMAFSLDLPTSIGMELMRFAQNWETLSSAYIMRDYSHVGCYFDDGGEAKRICDNDEEVEKTLCLLRYSSSKEYELED